MDKKEYNRWRKNGNFTISQERLLQVSNHISEGETSAYTKAEAAQVATYWSLMHEKKCNELQSVKLAFLSNAIVIINEHP